MHVLFFIETRYIKRLETFSAEFSRELQSRRQGERQNAG